MHKMFVFSGCSGVGKSTILKAIRKQRPDLRFSVSATTRAPRPDETDGVEYYFVSRETFQDMINKGAFLEYDAHMGNLYGTPEAQLGEKLACGDVLLDIEPVGAFNVRRIWPKESVLIFVAPPSLEELERRLRNRGDTSEEEMKERLARAAWEMEQGKSYDYYVINDTVETCVDEILNIIANAAK